MDFNQLSLLKEQTKGVHSQRQKQASNLLQEGLTLLTRVHEQGPTEALLSQTFYTLQQALQHNRAEPTAYIALGYLFLLVSDTPHALKYFRAVLDMVPNHPDALAFMGYIQNKASRPKASSELDYDALYDEIEVLIGEQCRAILGLPPYPVLERRRLNDLRLQVTQFQTNRETMAIKLALVDQDIDIADLQQQLLPFDERLGQLEQALAKSLRMVALEQQLETQLNVLESLEQSLHAKEPLLFDEALERVLDQCDACADQLDEIEKEGDSISELEPLYNQLLRVIEQFQEQLEEQ